MYSFVPILYLCFEVYICPIMNKQLCHFTVTVMSTNMKRSETTLKKFIKYLLFTEL